MKLYTLIVFFFFFNFSEAQTSTDSVLIKANNLLQIKETNQAILLLDETIKTIPNNLNKQSALQLLSKAYSKKGDDAKALSTLNEMMVLKDSLIKIETTQTLDALRAGYEADKQEKELALQKAKINQQQVIILAISICSLLSLGLVFLYFSRKKNALKNEMATAILKEKNNAAMAILAAEEKERKRIASDLHDGIGQMMSEVKMNLSSLAYKLTSLTPQEAALLEKTMALTDESCKEVRTVSHNMMPNALLKSGLSSAIKTFVDKIDHKKLKVNLHSEGLDNRLPDTVEIVLYRVIQETVNNVIKHAKANQLDIAIIKDVDGLSCTIEDNGIGFNFNDKNLTEGIGLKNIQARITYLQGTVEWDAIPNKGTLVSIHIPM